MAFSLALYLIAAIADSSRRRRCLAFSSQNLVSVFNEAEAHRGLLQPSTLRLGCWRRQGQECKNECRRRKKT